MTSKEQKQIEQISKEVRKQYESFNVQSLGREDVLPEQPVLTPHPVAATTAKPKKLSLKKRNRVADVMFYSLMLFLIVVLLTAILQRYYVGSTIVVSGKSMDPSYKSTTEVWVDKKRTPKRGDVIVLYAQDVSSKFWGEFAFGNSTKPGGNYEKLIKRLIALEGDKLWIEPKDGGHVLVIETAAGEIIREDYYTVPGRAGASAVFFDAHGNSDNRVDVPFVDFQGKSELDKATKENPFVVREGRIFYMGDNRYSSSDSRVPTILDVPVERIIGVVTGIVREAD